MTVVLVKIVYPNTYTDLPFLTYQCENEFSFVIENGSMS